MPNYKTKREQRSRRHMRLRKKISGSSACPRLSICFTLNHGYAQFIDDENGKTMISASTLEKDFPDTKMKGLEKAVVLADIAAKRAINSGISSVVFDRGGFKYQGRVKIFAETARKLGIQF